MSNSAKLKSLTRSHAANAVFTLSNYQRGADVAIHCGRDDALSHNVTINHMELFKIKIIKIK